jgi:two-component system, chemotaxis family, chemotaxis protein CheY
MTLSEGGPRMKVLIVDDSIVMRNIHKNILKDHNVKDGDFIEAGDGATALKLAEENLVDLFIIDWNIPNLDGLDLVTKLRAMSYYAKTPIVMVTAEAAKYNVIEAINAGVTNYVIKPIKESVLWEKISKYMH